MSDCRGSRGSRRPRPACLAVVAALTFLLPLEVQAVEIYDNFPPVIHAGEKYVIYSHGLIVEGDGPQPAHPEFGVYDFPAIKEALFKGGGFNLIAHHRPKGTDPLAYTDTLEAWVKRLISAGVSPENITLAGFSRGAQMTAQASSRLRASGINTALMALCSNGDFVRSPSVVLGGRVLSIYETTDVVGSCALLARRSELTSFEELAISTGRKHGAFFQPRPEWLLPLKAWIGRANPARPASISGRTQPTTLRTSRRPAE